MWKYQFCGQWRYIYVQMCVNMKPRSNSNLVLSHSEFRPILSWQEEIVYFSSEEQYRKIARPRALLFPVILWFFKHVLLKCNNAGSGSTLEFIVVSAIAEGTKIYTVTLRSPVRSVDWTEDSENDDHAVTTLVIKGDQSYENVQILSNFMETAERNVKLRVQNYDGNFVHRRHMRIRVWGPS